MTELTLRSITGDGMTRGGDGAAIMAITHIGVGVGVIPDGTVGTILTGAVTMAIIHTGVTTILIIIILIGVMEAVIMADMDIIIRAIITVVRQFVRGSVPEVIWLIHITRDYQD